MSGKPLTGRKVFAIVASAFGAIIAANLVLAWQAVGTFPGLEVENSYVASQTFNERLAAQQALGWTVDAEVTDGALVVRITGDDGRPSEVGALSATLGRPTHVREDRSPDFVYHQDAFRAPMDVAPGRWMLRLEATAPDGTTFRQRRTLIVEG
ncbi:nitrogen fixation protein FixH [Rhodobacteraceae bacterium WD3A24]|nr:nitrogen fixation protein FixH [Rhodobacteraceae bacterium WD3A24]